MVVVLAAQLLAVSGAPPGAQRKLTLVEGHSWQSGKLHFLLEGFKIELYILNTQGETVGYNEKYFCMH